MLALDPVGIKPLHVANDGSTLRMASQVKALRTGGQISDKPNASGHVGFFLLGYLPEPHRIYAGIRAVEAGGVEWFGRDGEHVATRTDPLVERAEAMSESSAQILAAAIADSVRHHLASDVPVGLFLSAGLDSATIAVHAVETHRDIQSLTLAFSEFSGSGRDEAPLVAQLATHIGTHHTTRT